MSGADDGSLDLDALVENASAELVLKHPVSGEPTPARITLAGPEHPQRKAAVFSRMRARRTELERTGRLAVSDPVDDEADETALLATCTLGWRGLKFGGQDLVFSAEAASKLLGDPKYRWLRDQVKIGLDQRELFIGGSAQA